MPHRSPIPPSWTIQPVRKKCHSEVLIFISHARKDMFPNRLLAPDDANLFGPGSYFIEARDKGRLIAVIGYVPYNHRFPQFDYHNSKTAEVVRLYVLAPYRCFGLATILFDMLRERAMMEGIRCFYLHTHPFLTKAIGFWEKRGFKVTHVEEDPEWRTTHMEMMLRDHNKESQLC